jgi:DNA-binding NarL/FixJ family response regulator
MSSILVIEDHILFAQVLQRFLTRQTDDVVQQIHAEFPQLRCLMLSGHLTPKYEKRALEAGAHGYVLKDDVNGILEGIRRSLAGEIYLSAAFRRYQ